MTPPSEDPYVELEATLDGAGWDELDDLVVDCRRCPRLVEHRERMAKEKRAAYDDQDYWGRPVPGFGDRRARLLVVGLAPAAHGANRTGRMFTGDRSGNWLYRAMHRSGFASQPTSRRRGDGLELADAFVTAPVRCAPPANRPAAEERRNCRPYLEREIDLLDEEAGIVAIVALGGYAYDHVLRIYRDRGYPVPSPKPKFGHGDVHALGPAGADAAAGPPWLISSYHPSQQNTFTGVLTEELLDRVFARARELLDRADGELGEGSDPE